MIYSDSDSFVADLGHSTVIGISSQSVLDQTLRLTAFDDTAGPNQHVVVHSSTYAVSLSALGSVVVINTDGVEASFSGSAAFNVMQIANGGSSGPAANTISNSNFLVSGGSAALFSDGVRSALTVALSDGGSAPTDGTDVDFEFSGTYDVGISGSTIFGEIFGTGSAYGGASIQTVYERFDLVAMVPEPSVLVLLLAAPLVVWRRRRN